MNICKYLCHQKPERSFFYKEKQFPVCSRCTGIVIGAAAGFVLASLTQPNLIFVLGFIPLVIDGTTQCYGLRTSNNTLRFIYRFCYVAFQYLLLFLKNRISYTQLFLNFPSCHLSALQ